MRLMIHHKFESFVERKADMLKIRRRGVDVPRRFILSAISRKRCLKFFKNGGLSFLGADLRLPGGTPLLTELLLRNKTDPGSHRRDRYTHTTSL